ncbi:MAG: hypothetical protein AAB461_03505, partial [Patescibacteria group bacterium]
RKKMVKQIDFGPVVSSFAQIGYLSFEGAYFAKASYGTARCYVGTCLPSVALCVGWLFEALM